MFEIGLAIFIIFILYLFVIVLKKEFAEISDYFQKIPYIVLVAVCILLIYVIPLILLIEFGKDTLVSNFENKISPILISYFYEKLFMGMFNFTKVYFFKNNLGKPINKLEEQYEYKFEILEQLIRMIMYVSFLSVYSAVISYSYCESIFSWLPVPFTRLIMFELIFVVIFSILVFIFHECLKVTIKKNRRELKLE